MERSLGIEDDLSFYVYMLLQEEEILDSKSEEDEWYDETANKIRRDDYRYQKKIEAMKKEDGGKEPMEEHKNGEAKIYTDPDAIPTGNFTYSPYGVKNFYHEPDSPSRAFLMDFMSLWYLLKLCYSMWLWHYLCIPWIFFPAWLVRWWVLIPQAVAAKGTVDGVWLALKNRWAINLDGGFTHWSKSSGDFFNVYPDISLAIHYAKKWHIQQWRRILVINTSVSQANGVIKDYPKDEGVYVWDIFDPTVYPRDKDTHNMIHEKANVGRFDNDESYLTKIRHRVNLALSSYAPDFVIYNAGYDWLGDDCYGKMNISESMIMLRDELIFREVIEDQGVPILMTIGGWYQRRMETVIARSIRNIIVKLDLSEKPLQATSAQNIRFAQKLQNKYSRYDNEELGFTGRGSRSGRGNFSRRGDGSMSRRSSDPKRPVRATYIDAQPTSTSDQKYEQIYNDLQRGLYDRKSIGRVDVFSGGRR